MKNFLKIIGLLALFILPIQVNAATLGLSPGSAEWTTGCTNTLSIVIDTEGVNSLAADAFLRYNPNEIEIIDQNGGIGGVQLGIGSVYESYPGNIVSNGIIRLTGFNRSGFFNGRGILGNIKVRGKPGVNSSTISFQFSPGSSVDSNVADQNSSDALRSVSNATIFFKPGKCPVITPPPKKPPKPSEADKLNEELDKCRDKLIVLENYYRTEQQEITTILCQGEELKPAAPSGIPRSLLLLLLIILALSLLLNIDMLVRPENHIVSQLPFGKRTKSTKAKFTKHHIRKTKK